MRPDSESPFVTFSFTRDDLCEHHSSTRLNINAMGTGSPSSLAQLAVEYICFCLSPTRPAPGSESMSTKQDAPPIFQAITQCVNSGPTQSTAQTIPTSKSNLPSCTSLSPKAQPKTCIQTATAFSFHRPALTAVMPVVRALLMCHGNQTCLLIAEIGYENRRANHVRSISLGLAYDQPKSSLSVWRRY